MIDGVAVKMSAAEFEVLRTCHVARVHIEIWRESLQRAEPTADCIEGLALNERFAMGAFGRLLAHRHRRDLDADTVRELRTALRAAAATLRDCKLGNLICFARSITSAGGDA